MPKSNLLKMEVNSQELRETLKRGGEHFVKKEMRGVVSEVVNTIRDGARSNAAAVGLSQTGPARMPSGRMHVRQGLIPKGIFSFVGKPKGKATTEGFVRVEDKSKRWHWYFVEHGTVRHPPTPFFFRALAETRGKAMTAAQERFDEGIPRILKQ